MIMKILHMIKNVPIVLVAAFFTLLWTDSKPSEAVELTVGSAEARAGSTVEVPITIGDAEGLEGLQFVLTYDPAGLENTGVEAGRMAGAADIDRKVREPGKVRIAMLPESTLDHGEGTLLTATFRVLSDGGKELQVAIEEAKASEFRGKFPVWMHVTTAPGTIRITAPALPIWMLIAVGAGLLILIVIIVMMKRKR